MVFVFENSKSIRNATPANSEGDFLIILVPELTEHPDITGRGEPSEVDALRGHPLDWQLPLRGFVVGVVFNPP